MSKEIQELKEKFLLPLKLQHFADGGSGGAGGEPEDTKEDDDDSDDEDDDDIDDEDDDEDDEDDNDDKKKKKTSKKAKAYTQSEVTRMIKNRLAREAKKQAKLAKKQEDTKKQDEKKDDTKKDDNSEKLLKQIEKMQQKMVQSEVKSALVSAGVDPAKVSKAMKLIEIDDILDEDDEVDAKLLRKEIKYLLRDFPNLKGTTSSGGFKFGSEDKQKSTGKIDEEISSIFGNAKQK